MEKHHAVFFYSSKSNRAFVENSQSLSANMQTCKHVFTGKLMQRLGGLGNQHLSLIPRA
jgi:hypothetical protein